MKKLIRHTMLFLMVFITMCNFGYPFEGETDSITFKHIFMMQTKMDEKHNITKKEFNNGEIFPQDIFYMISGLRNRKNIELKYFKNNKLEYSTNLYFLNESEGGIYLIEKTGTYNNNLWSIILTRGIVICTKQYLEKSSGNIYINTYLNKIESVF